MGSEYFAQRFDRPVDENGQKKFTDFLTTQVTFLADFWGYKWAYEGIFGSNVPLALLVDPWLMFPHKNKDFPTKNEANLGQNRPKLAKTRYTRNAKLAKFAKFAKFGARGLIFSPFHEGLPKKSSISDLVGY